MNELQSCIYKMRKRCDSPFTFHSLVSKNHNLSWIIWENKSYLLTWIEGKNTWRINSWQQLNGFIRSTPELDHQKCLRTASNFLVELNRWLRKKFSQWTYNIEKRSTPVGNIVFPMHNTASRAILVHSYIYLLPRSYATLIKSLIKSLNPYDLGSYLVIELWIGFDWYKSL